MMGHIFDVFLDMVQKKKGRDGVARVIAAAGLTTKKFRFEAVYPEEDFTAVVVASLAELDLTPDRLEIEFGEHFMDVSPKLFPSIFEACGGARRFLERLPHIHASFPAAAFSGVYRDKLTVNDSGPDWIEMRYDSPHKLCGLLRHLTHRLLAHYQETGEVEEIECARKGAPACRIRTRFLGKRSDRTP